MSQFNVLIVDDEFYPRVVKDLQNENLFNFVNFTDNLQDLCPPRINTLETQGIKIYVADCKQLFSENQTNVGAINLLLQENLNFDIFLLDVDLSSKHQSNSEEAQGYGFDIWREAANKFGTGDDRLYMIYTGSPDVLRLCKSLCYNPDEAKVKTSPLIIKYGTRENNYNKSIGKFIKEFIETRSKIYLSQIEGQLKSTVSQLLNKLLLKETWTELDIDNYQTLRNTEIISNSGDTWYFYNLLPHLFLSIDSYIKDRDIAKINKQISDINNYLQQIKKIIFSSYGDIIYNLLDEIYLNKCYNIILRNKIEEEGSRKVKDTSKINHYLENIENPELWKDVAEYLKQKYLEQLKQSRAEGHEDTFVQKFETIDQSLDNLKKFAVCESDYLGWIKARLYAKTRKDYKICVTKQDIELIVKVLTNNLRRNQSDDLPNLIPVDEGDISIQPTPIYINTNQDYVGYVGLCWKVATIQGNDDIDKIGEKLNKDIEQIKAKLNSSLYTPEQVSELYQIVCIYYNGFIEFCTPVGTIRKFPNQTATKNTRSEDKTANEIWWKFWFPKLK